MRFTSVGLAALIALIVLINGAENWRGKRAWEQCKLELAAKGKVLDWAAYIPAPVPGDKNVFEAPKMKEWFVGRGGTDLTRHLSLEGLYTFIQDQHTNDLANILAEVTILTPDAPAPADQADIILRYSPPVIMLVTAQSEVRSTNQDSLIERITMDEVRLSDAIKYLARQGGINYTLDLQLNSAPRSQNGVPLLEQSVSLNWKNMTARAALQALLQRYQLELVENPSNHVAHISYKGDGPVPKVIAEPAAREQLTKLLQATLDAETNGAAGKSTMGAQGFMLFTEQLEKAHPVRIFVRAEKIPEAAEIAAFIPGNLRAAGTVFTRQPRVKSVQTNSFHVWLSPQTHITAADYLAWSDQYEPDFSTIREALKRPYAQIVGDYSAPAAMPIPNFVTLRIVAQTLVQRAQCYLLLNQPEAALREVTLIHDLCRILEGRPTGKPMTLVAAMIDVAIRGLYVGGVADGLRLQAWKEPQLTAIQEQLKEIDLVPVLAESFESERAASCRTLETATPDEYDKILFQDGSRSLQQKLKNPGFLFLTLAPHGWVYQNMSTTARLDQNVIESFDVTHHLVLPRQADSANKASDAAANRPLPYNFFAGIMVPNYSRAAQTLALNQTRANLARVVCALERYHLVHSQYPETLNALARQFIDQLPPDIIGGQPLKYRAENGRFLLYSVGWNEKDDGGMTDPRKVIPVGQDNGDIVWPYRESQFR